MMGVEIERKFLVLGSPWKNLPVGEIMRQGYLVATSDRVVRVRVEGPVAMLTIKGAQQGITRSEWEYSVPLAEGLELLQLCEQPLIEKIRYRIINPVDNLLWELDVFMGANVGLVVAEIELNSEHQEWHKPDWVGAEVSHDARYLNANLQKKPYSTWVK